MKINILEYLEEIQKTFPQKIAVVDSEQDICFQDMVEKGKALAHVLLEKCNKKNSIIAVYMDKSVNCVLSDIGIIYSGNAYMNLDIKTPEQRIHNILDKIQPCCVITTKFLKSKLESLLYHEKLVCIDELDLSTIKWTQDEIDHRLSCLIDTDPLCIINTSGSTGTPKGVVLNHRSFIDFIEWANDTMKFSQDEVIGCLSPVVFDIYSYELCLMMSRSARMILLHENMAAFPVRILQTIAKEKVTFIFWVPTIMVNIANMGLLEKVPLPNLRLIWFAGEVFPTKQYNIWHKALPQARFVNMYGPIEITLDCTHYIITREISDDEPIPIGFAMRNTEILILNDDNNRCKVGEEGELCVRGTSLAMGYYNNPEKTAAAFVQNPLQKSYPEIIYRTGDIVLTNDIGEIIFRGRKDSLVKHSGYRIELGEIEHIIVNTLQLVKNGCVVYDKKRNEIVLFYESEQPLEVAELRKKIGLELPKYMIPTVFHYMDELPRNTNGKIDRLMLKEMVNE